MKIKLQSELELFSLNQPTFPTKSLTKPEEGIYKNRNYYLTFVKMEKDNKIAFKNPFSVDINRTDDDIDSGAPEDDFSDEELLVDELIKAYKNEDPETLWGNTFLNIPQLKDLTLEDVLTEICKRNEKGINFVAILKKIYQTKDSILQHIQTLRPLQY